MKMQHSSDQSPNQPQSHFPSPSPLQISLEESKDSENHIPIQQIRGTLIQYEEVEQATVSINSPMGIESYCPSPPTKRFNPQLIEMDGTDFMNSPLRNQSMNGASQSYLEFNFEGFKHKQLINKNLNMQCFLQTYTAKECIVCHPSLQNILLYDDSTIEKQTKQCTHGRTNQAQYQNLIVDNLKRKYMTSRDFYNVKVINDIIYNEPTHTVAVFKDYLIYDDLSEFLKRFYHFNEAETRLPKICEFYEKYSKVFPNYVQLPESKFMYKNIEKKQKIIDDKQKYLQEKLQAKTERMKKKFGVSIQDIKEEDVLQYESSLSWLKDSEIRFFNTQFVDSVLKDQNQSQLTQKQSQHQSFVQRSQQLEQSGIKNLIPQLKQKQFSEMNLDSLVNAFIQKDAMNSQLQISKLTANLDITMQSFQQNDESEKFIKSLLLKEQLRQKEILMSRIQKKDEQRNKQIKIQPQLQVQQKIDQNLQKQKQLQTNNPYTQSQRQMNNQIEKKLSTSPKQYPIQQAQQQPQQIQNSQKPLDIQQIYGNTLTLKNQYGQNNHLISTQRLLVRKQNSNNKNQVINPQPQGNYLATYGSITHRDTLKKKLFSNQFNTNGVVINNEAIHNQNFSPLEIQDHTYQQNSKKPMIMNRIFESNFGGSQSARQLSNNNNQCQVKPQVYQNPSLNPQVFDYNIPQRVMEKPSLRNRLIDLNTNAIPSIFNDNQQNFSQNNLEYSGNNHILQFSSNLHDTHGSIVQRSNSNKQKVQQQIQNLYRPSNSSLGHSGLIQLQNSQSTQNLIKNQQETIIESLYQGAKTSRNVLGKQNELQKHSRGQNPRQKSGSKSKRRQNSINHQQNQQHNLPNAMSETLNNQMLQYQFVQNHLPQSQISTPLAGIQNRQNSLLMRNNSTGVLLENHQLNHAHYQPNLIGQANTSKVGNITHRKTTTINAQALIQSKKQASANKSSKNASLKSISQNRMRDISPMDINPILLSQQTTTTQNTTRYRKVLQPERRSLDKASGPPKFVLPYQSGAFDPLDLMSSQKISKIQQEQPMSITNEPITQRYKTNGGLILGDKKFVIGKKSTLKVANMIASRSNSKKKKIVQ